MLVAVLMSAALVVAASTSKKLKLRMKDLKRSAYVAFAASLIAGIALVPSAGASGVFKISNTSHSATVGTSITVKTTGGSGSGAVTFSVSGMNCTIGAKSGVLSASAATTCSVKATKAASKGNKAQTSSASFTFTAPVTTTTTTMPTTTTTTPAKSSDSPTPSTPDVATLTSVTGASSAQINDTANGDTYFIDQFYNANDHWYAYYITPGATVTLNWHVNGSNGSPLANAPVTLLGNLDYSCDPGVKWTTTSLDANPGCNSGTQGSLSGTTDSSGNVSFTITDADTASTTAATDQTTTAGVATNEASGSAFPWTDMVLQVGSDTFTASPNTTVNQATDRVDFIVSPAPTPQSSVVSVTPTPAADSVAPTFASPDSAVLTSITGNTGQLLNGTADGDGGGSGWIPTYYHQGDRWLLAYVNAGATIQMTWLVTGDNGQPLPNQPVTLESNIDYSCATGLYWSTTSLDFDPGCNSGTQGSLSGTTNAQGIVTFTTTLVNTNVGNSCTEASYALAAENSENSGCDFSNMLLQIDPLNGNFTHTGVYNTGSGTSVTEITDRIDFLEVPPVSSASESPSYVTPDVATLSSVTGTAGSQIDATADGNGEFINQYFHPGNRWLLDYVVPGSTVAMTWHVTGSNGEPLANKAVTLTCDLAYSNSSGVNWSSPGSGCTGGPDPVTFSGETDANGNVTFTFVNSNQASDAGSCTVASSASDAEASEPTPNHAWTNTNNACKFGRFILTVVGDNPASGNETTQITDMVDFLLLGTAASNATHIAPDIARLTSVTGLKTGTSELTGTSAMQNNGVFSYMNTNDNWLFGYITASSTITLTWHVTDNSGNALANQKVTLQSNLGYSCANGVTWQTSSLNVNYANNPCVYSGAQGTLGGTTDSSGNVTFTLVNSNTTASADPSNLSSASAAQAAEAGNDWTDFALQIGNDFNTDNPDSGVNQLTDRLDILVIQ